MRAKLEYIVNGVRIPLESMEFEKIDQFTYNAFDTEDDIISSDRYKHLLKGLPKDGKVVVSYSPADILSTNIDNYARLGGNPFSKEECMRVLVHSSGYGTTLHSVRKKMYSYIDSPEVAEKFFEFFETEYTPKERMDHLLGMLTEDSQLVSSGIKRIMLDYTSGSDAYFMGRAFVERLSNFKSCNKISKEMVKTPTEK